MSALNSADRNLLFGILSLQSGIITESQLLIAMNRWTIQKQKSLAEILCDSGALTSEQMRLMEPMADAHIRLHQGSSEAALRSLTFVPDIAESLRGGIPDADVQVSLDRFGSTFQSRTLPKSSSAALADIRGNSDSRYTPRHLHAQGGLGAVYSAIDSELNREVALKEIRPEFAGHLESRARFVLEAEITGGLEHPGIVPVYGLGHYADGRPFYAMRFIRGKSLKDAIDEFHGGKGVDATKLQPGTDRSYDTDGGTESGPGFDGLAFRKLLGRFVDVCQAISYAHSRGVLHRDLKPGNIMLGKYGETLVVDWGLAKVQDRADASVQPGERT